MVYVCMYTCHNLSALSADFVHKYHTRERNKPSSQLHICLSIYSWVSSEYNKIALEVKFQTANLL